jgi:hypothetical protein
MILPKLVGKGLFVFSDPGGAKPILSYATLNPSLSDILVISDRKYPFYNDFQISVNFYNNESIAEIIDKHKPNFVFTGTSYTSKLEIKFIKIAKELGIPTYSFIDHYTSFLERFDLDGERVYPDFICLIDDIAKSILLQNKIEVPAMITGNYFHEYLKRWKPIYTKKELLEKVGTQLSKKKLCVYGPDPLSNKVKVNQFDFDELEATKQLSKIAEELKETHQFILNPHPNQNLEKISKACGNHMFLITQPVDVNSLIYYADVVLGFFSNFLVEATILKKPVLRFFLNKEMSDPFEKMNIGKVVYPENIISELQQIN